MRTLLISVCLMLFSTCSFGAIEDGKDLFDVVTSPEAFTVCTVADVATTVAAIQLGVGVEANPLLSGSVNAHHFLPLVLSKLAVIGLIYWLYTEYEASQAAKLGVGAASAITCGVAANNLLLIVK